MTDPVLIADPAVTAIPIQDCGEPFVDARHSGLLIDGRVADPGGFYRRVRLGVLARLKAADDLLPPGWRLALVEGYRPVALQRRQFQDHLNLLVIENPHLSAPTLHRLATRHIAPVLADGHPPHSTGGAVDLTIYDADGIEVQVGCPVNATPAESGGACYTDAPDLITSHRRNRDLLVDALAAAGFVNYAPEWWHWSYGDQYWALQTGSPTTRYARAAEADVLAAP